MLRGKARLLGSDKMSWAAVARSLVLRRLVITVLALAIFSPRSYAVEALPLTPKSALGLAARRRRLTLEPTRFSWIPGTHRLLLSTVSQADGRPWVFAVDADAGTAAPLLEGLQPTVSPDGSKIAFLAPAKEAKSESDAAVQLWVSDTNGENRFQLTARPGGIAPGRMSRVELQWSPDSKAILYLPVVYSTDFTDLPSDDIKREHGSSAVVYPLVSAALNDRGIVPSDDIHKVDRTTGDDEIAIKSANASSIAWLSPETFIYETGRTQSRNNNAPDLFTDLVVYSLKTHEKEILVSGFHRQPGYHAQVSPSGQAIAFEADPGQEVIYPYRREIAVCFIRTGRVKVLTHFAAARIGTWTYDEKGLIYVDGKSTRRELHFISLSGKSYPITAGSGVNDQPRFSVDGTLLAWTFTDDEGSKSLRVGRWNGARLSAVRDIVRLDTPTSEVVVGKTAAIEWRSRDGLLVDGYLTFPASYRASTKYPVVVVLHGGPLGGVSVGYSEWPAGPYFPHLLATSGYVVFAPDYRESGMMGYDKLLLAKARGERFTKDMDDILSGVEHLVRRGIADPHRLFLIGHSNGSLETNWIITHSDIFRAAVSYEGTDYLFDWGSWIGEPNHTWEWFMNGSPLERMSAYVRNSAVMNSRTLTTPTLFVTGGQPRLATNSPAMRWLYAALRHKGVDTEYVSYPDEGHTVRRAENESDLLERILGWIKEHDIHHAQSPGN